MPVLSMVQPLCIEATESTITWVMQELNKDLRNHLSSASSDQIVEADDASNDEENDQLDEPMLSAVSGVPSLVSWRSFKHSFCARHGEHGRRYFRVSTRKMQCSKSSLLEQRHRAIHWAQAGVVLDGDESIADVGDAENPIAG